jgi:hypothetical protein
LLTLITRERDDFVIKAGNGNAAVMVPHLGEQLAESHGGVVHGTAINSGMQVARRSMQNNLRRDDPPQSVSQGRQFHCRNAIVGNDDAIAAQILCVFPQESAETFAAHLLLSFDDERKIARQVGAGLQIGFDRVQVGEVLALVIAGAPGEKRTPFDVRLEGGGLPQLERLGRLDVVVAVNHIVRFA